MSGARLVTIVASLTLVVGVALWVFADAFDHRPGEGPAASAPVPAPPTATSWFAAGRVLTPEDAPVAGADVEAWWCEGPRAEVIARGRSDADGRFRLSLAALADLTATARMAGALELRAQARGHGQPAAQAYAGHWDARHEAAGDTARDGVIVRIEAPEPRPVDATLRLLPGSVLRGRLVDAGGTPATDVGLELRNQEDGRALLACTDPAGRFALVAAPGSAWMARAVHPGYGEHVSGPHTVAADGLDLGDLPMAGSAVIEGRLVDDGHDPWAGVEVRASETAFPGGSIYMVPLPACFGTAGGPQRARATTDADGRFSLPLPTSSSDWALEVRVGDRFETLEPPEARMPPPAPPPPGADPREHHEYRRQRSRFEARRRGVLAGTTDLMPTWSGHLVRVRALDASGRPLASARVEATGWAGPAPTGTDRQPGDGTSTWSYSLPADVHGTCDFFASPGTHWHLEAHVRGTAPPTLYVEVPTTSRETHIDLVVGGP